MGQNRKVEHLRIATAQFEHRSGDKAYNLGVIRQLTELAAASRARIVAFHECSVTGYTFARRLSRGQMLELAESVPEGESVQTLIRIARDSSVTVLAGLFEKDADGQLYKAYV
ncbi:MAG: Nitrilase/cyanide hydratase and apolipoprotein N-acyltransferase, partial [Bryobacterales bacterium]|nr:Nitrilase/cyanide hydratase and apolipoprotein N-acyltransferase [Bryobacterales bacterium]